MELPKKSDDRTKQAGESYKRRSKTMRASESTGKLKVLGAEWAMGKMRTATRLDLRGHT